MSKFSYIPIEVKEVGTSASAIFCASEKQGENLELGDLEIFTPKFSGGQIFTVICGPKRVLSLITWPDINIALIRLILKRAGEELKKIFEGSLYKDQDDPINFFRFK